MPSDHPQAANRRSLLLKSCLFATGLAGIVAEFVLSTIASYLLGNTTLQWTLVMSLMLFSMGLGSRLSRHLADRLLDRFVAIEFALSLLCATSAAAAYFGAALLGDTVAVIYGYAIAIGLLIGLEIPLVTRMNEAYEELRSNIASVLEKDYFGALVGGLLFAFFLLPRLGLTYTPVALGFVNFAVASALLWRYRHLLTHRGRLVALFWSCAVALALLAAFIRPIVLFGEQAQYRDRVIYEAQTPYQRIVITEWKGRHWLYLDGHVQFSTYDEVRYHEPLVHPAMLLSSSPRDVLVLGGGDGLAVREILKHPEVESVTLVDLDPAVVELARTHPAMLEANLGSLEDPRVRVLNQDAGRFLEASSALFDVIIVDLPDPRGPNLARLYSREFYRTCANHLSRNGVLVTQSTSPLHARSAFLCIRRTMESAGLTTLPYHNVIPTMGDWSWILGVPSDRVSPEALRQRVLDLKLSAVPTAFLDSDAMEGMTRFWKGMWNGIDTIDVSTELEPTVDRYYREAEWGLN